MSGGDPRDEGRAAFVRRAWTEAFARLSAADADRPLDLDDRERLAIAAQLSGRHDDATSAWARAYRDSEADGDVGRAVRSAFWLGLAFDQHGESAQAGAWLGRAAQLVDDAGGGLIGAPVAAEGYLAVAQALGSLRGGDLAEAHSMFERVAEIGTRFDDRDLITMGRLGRGQALVAMSETARGVAFLDEAMLGVVSGETSPILAGIVYCSVIEACQESFDLRRAREWTAALARWCDAQPDLVPFRGRCLVYRAELLRFDGAWQDAIAEAARAMDWLAGPPEEPAIGEAYYEQAEQHRLQGDAAEAVRLYRAASRRGRSPQPGLSLLRLTQGRAGAAAASIRRALAEATGDLDRARLLEPAVEIALATDDIAAARAAADELARIAEAFDTPLVHATALGADGAVCLASGEVEAALARLRRAFEAWRDLDAPYQAARVRVRIGRACGELGDLEGAALEFDAARADFAALGARPDLAWLDQTESGRAPATAHGLSRREFEVLRLVARGDANRAIADALGISERTVDRHVSNIFAKLDVSSRAGATAYAYEHGLV